MHLRQSLVGITFLFVCRAAGDCQGPIQFDAAVIKLDQRGPGVAGLKGGPGTSDPGRVTWGKVWLQTMLAAAFEVDADKISGPDWMYHNGAQMYLFTATMPPDTTKHDFHLMLQKFLVEQFGMQLRHEAKLFPAFELVAAPGGAKLKTSAFANDPEPADSRIFAQDLGADGFPVLPPGHSSAQAFKDGQTRYKCQKCTVAEIANYLAGVLSVGADRTNHVLDKTGLTGLYDMTLAFHADSQAIKFGPNVQAARGGQVEGEPDGASDIVKAVEKQLGLKMVKTKDILLDTIIVDKARRIPAGN
jgi:uncharacterized protein (TIGR03435 family)